MLQEPRDNPNLAGNPDLPPLITPVPNEDIPIAPNNDISPMHGNDISPLAAEDERLDDGDLSDDTMSEGDI